MIPSRSRLFITRHVVPGVFSLIVFAPLVFMFMDREPPYERIGGSIMPVNPSPGAQIEARWEVKTYRTCTPAAGRNVTRRIVDSHGVVWDFDPVPSIYGREVTARDSPSQIARVLSLPQGIARGPATYSSSACFACNPVQHLWPICIDRPDITFNISAPVGNGLSVPEGARGP